MTTLYGWGRYPRKEVQLTLPMSFAECSSLARSNGPLIARGLGRSYGDSSLAANVLLTERLDRFQAFDETTGELTCDAGVSLADILRIFVPKGWFLPVTPGTRFVTVGGAVASDVHGKNHHVHGTFCDHIGGIELMIGNGECVYVSPTNYPDLFHATCGGMGLTGVILSVTLRLKRIRASDILATTYRLPNLEAALEAFEAHNASTYSVAWIDCLARGRSLGRSLLMVGEHAEDGPLKVRIGHPIPVPFDMPAFLLNRATVQTFNALYYRRALGASQSYCSAFEPFFYPLDALGKWNRLYGKSGFLQYQFALPKTAGLAGMRVILEHISKSGKGSFLGVLKAFGPVNKNVLSFPIEGYTLALDFKVESSVFGLLDVLDRVVLDNGGRLYLSKDARMSEGTFKSSYGRWQEFEEVRARWHAHGRFSSTQSRRIGLL